MKSEVFTFYVFDFVLEWLNENLSRFGYWVPMCPLWQKGYQTHAGRRRELVTNNAGIDFDIMNCRLGGKNPKAVVPLAEKRLR